jgi:hypothetical protein
MPNVHLFTEAAHQAYGGKLLGLQIVIALDPWGWDVFLFCLCFRAKDAGCRGSTTPAKPAQVDQTDRPLLRSDLLSTLSQLK